MKQEYNRAMEEIRLSHEASERIWKALEKRQLERPRPVWRRRGTAVLAAAAVIAVMTGTAFSVVYRTGVLEAFFQENSSALEPYLQTSMDSVENEDYRLTVDSALYDGKTVFLVVTVTGLNEQAAADLKNNRVIAESHRESWGQETADGLLESGKAGPDTFEAEGPSALRQQSGWSMGGGELPAPSEASRAWRIDIDFKTFAGPQEEPLRLWLDFMGEEHAVAIPLDTVMEPIRITPDQEVTIDGISGKRGVLKEFILSATSYEWKVVETEKGEETDNTTQLDGLFFLRMKDGTIWTKAQLGGNGQKFKIPVDLTQVESIIYGDMEFPVDGSPAVPAELDEHLYPFAAELLYYPVAGGARNYIANMEALCRSLGAEYQWDGARGTATATYRGVTILLTAGSSTALVNGEAVEMETWFWNEDGEKQTVPLPVVEYNGTLAAIVTVFSDAWNLDVDASRAQRPEAGESWPEHGNFLIIP